ncbi:MAG: RidA family protein [Thermoplasmata archaeon]|nr:RidA family protein [Thermoplasmata archaeon]
MARVNYSSGTRWEPRVGYSRAVRVREHVYVSGTTATNGEGQVVGAGDAYAQTRQAIANIETALLHVGATLKDVVRTRMFVTRMADWEQVGQAHAESFGASPPASTMVEVRRLVDPEMLIEVEADAIVEDVEPAPRPRGPTHLDGDAPGTG